MAFHHRLFRCLHDPRFRLLTFPERAWLPVYYDLVDEPCRAKQLADGAPLEPGAGPWWHDSYWKIYREVYQPPLTVADFLGNLLFLLGSLFLLVVFASVIGIALIVGAIAALLSVVVNHLARAWWRRRVRQQHEQPDGAMRRQKD